MTESSSFSSSPGSNQNNNGSREWSTGDIERTALRISINTWSALAAKSDTLNDADLLKTYILLCPYLSPESPAVQAALSGLQRAPTAQEGHIQKPQGEDQRPPSNHHHSPPEVVDLLSDGGHSEDHSSHEGDIDDDIDNDDDSDKEYKPSMPRRSVLSKTKPPTTIMKRHSPTLSPAVGNWFRFLFLDLPLVILFVSYLSLVWLHRVHDIYLEPQMEAAVWTDARAEEEITYYLRSCHAEDLSTHNPSDLFLPEDVSPQDAYNHQLKHGFSVFPNAMTSETAAELRSFITKRNRNLTESESIYVINNQNRYSFGLDTRDAPVAKAMQELTSHTPLFRAVEEIMGPAPALIEMTAITSSYGAVDQWWHDDVVAESSPVQYARTFGPSYSVFVVLQDTTKAMGATGACPGSHMCADGPISQFCDAEGYQLVGPDGYWKTGDALLMNMDSWHRGSAHRDPNALDRVMLILTWAPRPQAKAESRQMAQGITFSLRWDHWGMTWRDLRAGRFQFPPWMRSLALFKPSNAVWGLDYISSSSMRMANYDNGFRPDELDTFIERDGGIWYLPKFLHGSVEEGESWHEYFLGTLKNCEKFLFRVIVASMGAYLSFFKFVSFLGRGDPSSGGLGRAIRRMTISHGLVLVLFLMANYHVDHTQWAKDIQKNLRYSNAFVEEEPVYSLDAPTTFPHRQDVLIATRYSSEWLHMYNDWFDNHPGNNLLDRLISEAVDTYQTYPNDSLFRNATIQYIVGAIATEHGRFLHQSTHGTWRLMSDDDSATHVATELHCKANPFLSKLRKAIGFIQSDYRYGEHRSTVLAKKISLPYLQDLQFKLTGISPTFNSSNKASILTSKVQPQIPNSLVRTNPLLPRNPTRVVMKRLIATTTKAKKMTMIPRSSLIILKVTTTKPVTSSPPHSKAWMKSGDLVEVRLLEDGKPRWYLGKLTHVTASRFYHVDFFDGDDMLITDQLEDLRPYSTHPYNVGESIGLLDYDQEKYVSAAILKRHDHHHHHHHSEQEEDIDTFDVRIQNGQILPHVHPGLFRRYR